MLGGRPSRVRAAVCIQEGFVRHKDYAAFVEVFPKESKPGWSTPYSYTLIAEVATVESLPPGLVARSPHPAYWIGSPGGCEICIKSEVRLTPAASSEDAQRLSQIDLSCITRWLYPCRSREDIMPAAWAEMRHEED
jgi:hypothetical protein